MEISCKHQCRNSEYQRSINQNRINDFYFIHIKFKAYTRLFHLISLYKLFQGRTFHLAGEEGIAKFLAIFPHHHGWD